MELFLERPAIGDSIENILTSYPHLSEGDIRRALTFMVKLLSP
ncbi:DUF433 domain-containing protein [Thermodesulfatator autotrophicus]